VEELRNSETGQKIEDGAREFGSDVSEGARSFGKDAVEGFQSAAETVREHPIYEGAKELGSDAVDGIQSAAASVKERVDPLMDSVGDKFQEVRKDISEAVSSI